MLQIYKDPHYISEFSIYAERHNGTSFLQSSIEQSFNLKFTSFYGGKHWMGYADPDSIRCNARNVLFFGIVRHPYDWIYAFYNAPHHVPKHIKSNRHSFLSSEWYSINNNKQEIMRDRNFLTNNRYKNIFELRSTKIKYLVETMPLISSNYILVTYEYFTKYYDNFLEIISDRYRLARKKNNLKAIIKDPITIPHSDIKSIIDSSIDWDLESVFGYSKR